MKKEEAKQKIFDLFNEGNLNEVLNIIDTIYDLKEDKDVLDVLKYVLKTHHIVDTFTGRKFQVIGTHSNYNAKDIYKIFLSNKK